MDLLEPSGNFGRLDKTFLGTWLALDPAFRAPDSEHLLPLVWASFHEPLDDRHRQFISQQPAGDTRGFAVTAMTAAAHEARHFHDLLLTPYGATLARQHSRAALLVRASFDEFLFHSTAIVVPLSAWETNWSLLHELDQEVQAPSEPLAALGRELATVLEKLTAFDTGTLLPSLNITASSIMEGIAALVQAQIIQREFGNDVQEDFLTFLRTHGAYARYFGVFEWLLTALGPMPREATLLILLASLCGDYQERNQNIVRYPKDLLLVLVDWLHRRGVNPGQLATFDELADRIDDFFDEQFGDDLQGLLSRSVRFNYETVVPTFAAMSSEVAKSRGSEDPGLTAIVDAFQSLVHTSGGFVGNVVPDPSWYCDVRYSELWPSLPRPLVFLTAEMGLPITPELEQAFYVESEAQFIAESGPVRQLAESWGIDHPRVAYVICLRPELAGRTVSSDIPVALPFQMPPLDLSSWLTQYEGSIWLLRLLLEGEETPLPEATRLVQLHVFSLVGTNVYGLGGRLAMPSVHQALESFRQDPQMPRHLLDPEFLDLLGQLRRTKGRLE